MTFDELKAEILPTIPHNSGIYKYFDKNDKILYIGKAKDLRRRVASYFNKNISHGKTKILVKQIARIEFTVVETEQDALLLENVMIKKMQPKYNILLKDDKTYPYICIKKEAFSRVFLTRELKKDGSEYFGPYASRYSIRIVLDMIKQLFTLRTCTLNLSDKHIQNQKYKVCLEYHIGNCKAPCVGKQNAKEYDEMIQQIRKILKGNVSSVIKYLKSKIAEYAKNYEFEQAHFLKEKLDLLQNYQSKSTVVNPKINNVDVFQIDENEKRAFVSYLKVVNGAIIQTKVIELVKKLEESTAELLLFGINEMRLQLQSNSQEMLLPFEIDFPDKKIKQTIPQLGDKKKLLDLAQKNAFYYRKQYELKMIARKSPAERALGVLQELKKVLRLKETPIHIECFDNSNFQGAYPVASMVCFKNGKPAKKDYRHYKIKTVVGPDDFASMEEVVHRRYASLIEKNKTLPQLIVIDGGKGQLSSAVKSLKKLDIYDKVAIIGIAKKLEEIYVPNDSIPLHIDKRSASLKLLQHLRNEAHRFAITFHRNLRDKGTLQSELEQIKGVGKKTSDKLFKHFKSISAICEASEEELRKLVSFSQMKAIKAYFAEKKHD